MKARSLSWFGKQHALIGENNTTTPKMISELSQFDFQKEKSRLTALVVTITSGMHCRHYVRRIQLYNKSGW
jgi:hypothetical protein